MVQGDEGRTADETAAERERLVDQAVDELRRAFRTDPDPAVVRHHLALLRSDDDQEAVLDLRGDDALVDLTGEPDAGEPDQP
jgi:hypothetical protein